MHHNVMKDILFTVNEIKRILKPAGFIYITFPLLQGFYVKKENMKKVEPELTFP